MYLRSIRRLNGNHMANLTAVGDKIRVSGDLETGNGNRVDDLASRLQSAEATITTLSSLALLSFNYNGEYQAGNRYTAAFGWGAQTRVSCATLCLQQTDCVAFQFSCGYDGCSSANLCFTNTCSCWGFTNAQYTLGDPGGSFESYTVKWKAQFH